MSRLSRLCDDSSLRHYLRHHFLACALLSLEVSTTRCPCSLERRKFSVGSRFLFPPFCSLPLTALCYFSFDSFTKEIKLCSSHMGFCCFFHGHQRRYRSSHGGAGPTGLKMGHLGYFGILCIYLHQTWHMNLCCSPNLK